MQLSWLKTLRSDHVDLTLKTGGGLVTRIIERPGRWMEPHALAALRSELRDVAATSLADGPLDYGVLAEGAALKDNIVTVVYRREEGRLRPIAFNALAYVDLTINGRPETAIHLGLVMVDPGVRSRGLSWVLYGLTCLIVFVRNQLRSFWISNVTQVPAVVGLVGSNFSDVFPDPVAGTRKTFAHVMLARAIMRDHRHVFGVGEDARFDEERFVIENAYTGGSDHLKKSFAQSASHRDTRYGDFCRDNLDYDRGDDIIQIGRMDLNSARRYIARSVPRRSLGFLAMTAGLAGLQGLLLPLIHWLDSSRQWGTLRPWT